MNGNYGNCEGISIRKIRGQRERVEGMEERRPSGFDFGVVGYWVSGKGMMESRTFGCGSPKRIRRGIGEIGWR